MVCSDTQQYRGLVMNREQAQEYLAEIGWFGEDGISHLELPQPDYVIT